MGNATEAHQLFMLSNFTAIYAVGCPLQAHNQSQRFENEKEGYTTMLYCIEPA